MRFVVSLSLVIAAVFVSPVLAQDSTPTKSPARRPVYEGQQEKNSIVRDALRPTVMDELAEVRDTREENRQALRERIRTVRDENKLLALERIEDMLNRINQRRTDHFLRVIERLRSILARITTRTDRAKQAGKDVTGAEALIAQATASIDSAEQAVQTQKAKVYELNVTDETTARDEVSATVNSLHEDLRAVRDLVNDARQAVFNALQELVGVVKEPALPEPSAEGATQ